ncbi:RHTO0S23e00980g1_1 [Rhodotorula toruloides]|uniref:RHTO0S23e00980g1_1 n=1 Tax=Rhodotorula toruloides TaxID=5286 RepID=A0A061BGP2_RHOTO|nr:RHTO0S23e00980g1_1 [Rhodotorula toruloides]
MGSTDVRDAKRTQPNSTPAPQLDALSVLPPEILTAIFLQLDDPPTPLSRRLLPYSRAARLQHVEISSYKQLLLFVRTLSTVQGTGRLVKSFSTNLREETERLIAIERPTLNSLLGDAFALMPAVKEVIATNWVVSSFILSEGTPKSLSRSMRNLRISLLLGQITNTDFITYRLALLSRYEELRKLEIMVLPYDPGASAAVAFDLFPANDLAPPPLDMDRISQVEHLTLGGPLCDQRVVNVLRAFEGLAEVTLYDSFASKHVAGAAAAIDTSNLRSLRLLRLVGTPPPVDLPMQQTDWTRYANLRELFIGMPVCTDELATTLAAAPHLEELYFGGYSDPTASQIRHILHHRPPSLRLLSLSHVTGEVGEPITPASLPSISIWLDAVRALNNDPTSTNVVPVFPLLDWRLPAWTESFTPSDAESLFPLARQAGITLAGSLLSAVLTTYVLERQLDVWQGQVDVGGEEAIDEETKQVMASKPFWDALSLRYKARLLDERTWGIGEAGEDARMAEV